MRQPFIRAAGAALIASRQYARIPLLIVAAVCIQLRLICNLLDGMVRVAPEARETFEKNREAFLARVEDAMVRWRKTLEPFKGAKVVVYHPDYAYFLARFGVAQAGMLEDRPGIPPSPQHLAQLIRQMKDERVKVMLVQPWNDLKLAQRVADEAGAKAVVVPTMVGGVKGADTYIGAIDYNVNALAQALR